MTTITDEIDALLESTVAGRPRSFEPVRAKRRQLLRRRYTRTTGATLVVAAVVIGSYQLQGGGTGHKAVPASSPPTAATPHPQPAVQSSGLPSFAGTAWSIDRLDTNPDGDPTGGGAVAASVFARIRFSSDTVGVLSMGGATVPVTLAKGQDNGTVVVTEGRQQPSKVSAGLEDGLNALQTIMASPLKVELQASGTKLLLATADGEAITLTRLSRVGPLGLPGDKAWSVHSISTPAGAVTVLASLDARFRLDNAHQGQFAVGANHDLVAVVATAGSVQLTVHPFTAKKAKPGELAVTRALASIGGPLTATSDGRTLVLTSTQGATLTLVSNG
jgi:hypothetical protein